MAAINRIETIVNTERIDCDFERLNGYLFRSPEDDDDVLIQEMAAAQRAGIDVTLVENPPRPSIETGGALLFPNQAQFHPLKYCAGLARAIERACDAQIEGRYATVDAFARDLDALRKSSRVQRMAYQGAVIAAVLMVALAGLEVRARIAGDRRGPVAWFGPLSGGSVNPVNNPVIAVLPFRNLSSEPGHDLLVDSVTSGLIGQLAIIDGLQVKSQHSSFMLRNATITDVGKRLGVNLAVEGDAQLAKNTLLVRVALVSVADDRQLWSGTVERHLKSEGDIVSVVEEVTRTLVNRSRGSCALAQAATMGSQRSPLRNSDRMLVSSR